MILDDSKMHWLWLGPGNLFSPFGLPKGLAMAQAFV